MVENEFLLSFITIIFAKLLLIQHIVKPGLSVQVVINDSTVIGTGIFVTKQCTCKVPMLHNNGNSGILAAAEQITVGH